MNCPISREQHSFSAPWRAKAGRQPESLHWGCHRHATTSSRSAWSLHRSRQLELSHPLEERGVGACLGISCSQFRRVISKLPEVMPSEPSRLRPSLRNSSTFRSSSSISPLTKATASRLATSTTKCWKLASETAHLPATGMKERRSLEAEEGMDAVNSIVIWFSAFRAGLPFAGYVLEHYFPVVNTFSENNIPKPETASDGCDDELGRSPLSKRFF